MEDETQDELAARRARPDRKRPAIRVARRKVGISESDVRKACLVLGIRSQELATDIVVERHRNEIEKTTLSAGGDECLWYLDRARDTLLKWLAQAGR